MTDSVDVAVLGAGPAGLMAALGLCRAGDQVTVVDQAPQVGGMAASFDVGGVQVDHGSHRLHPSIDPGIREELENLLELQVRPRNGRVHLGGRWVAFPLRPLDLVRRLPLRLGAGVVRDALAGPFRRARADTFEEVVRARLGPTVARDFYAPYVHKIWGVPPDQLTGELADRRVSAESIASLARRALGRRRGRTFLYPAGGFGEISERLAVAVTEAGGEIALGQAVEAIALGEDRVGVRLRDGRALEADRAWSTLPVGALASLVEPPAPTPVAEAADRLEHRGLVLVYLVLDRPRYTPFDAHYVPDRLVPLSRVSEPKNYRDGPDPEDRTVVCAEVPCSMGDGRWTATDEDLGAEVCEALERIGLPPPRPVAIEARRLPRVYPVYRPGFEADLAALEQWVGGLSRLLTFGRQGLFVGDNTHHVLAMGKAAAHCLRPDGAFDDAGWAEALDRFRANVVED